jgi:predicted phage-related endonuclease
MLLTDSYYGEIIALVGGNQIKVYPAERSDYICNKILKVNTDFWENRILPAREAYAKYLTTKKEEYLAEVYSYEPEPDANPAYSEYFSDRHLVEDVDIKGTEEMKKLVCETIDMQEYEKKIKSSVTELKNKVTYLFVKEQVDKINFDELGSVRYFLARGTNNKQLSLKSIKYKPEIDKIDKNISEFINKITTK